MKDDRKTVAAVLAGCLAFSGAVWAQASTDAEKCSAATGSPDQTTAACTRAIDSKQYSGANLAILLNSRGLTWRERGFDDVALADFDEAIRIDPSNATAYVSRGNLYGDRGENDQAIADFDAALKLNPKIAPAYSNRALSWAAKRDYDQALADLNRAIQLDPMMFDAYNSRGFVWRAKGDVQRAIADFSQAIKIEPRFADAYDSLALIYAISADPKVRNGKRAVELSWKALELVEWKNPYYLNTLAAAQAETGDFKAAVATQSRALGMRAFSPAGESAAMERLKLYQEGKPFREPERKRAK